MNPTLKTILEQQFLNKRILIPVPERDQKGKLIPTKTINIAGQCTFIGSNETLGWDIQVTLDDQMPVQVSHINDIKLAPDGTRNKKKTN